MNQLAEAIKNATTTENGHYAVKSTGSAVLDLYGQVGALRGMDFTSRVKPLFDRALAEDKLLTAKTMFYARDIRGGTGERQLFRDMLRYAAVHCPEIIRPNIALIPEFGRWDDLYTLVGTPLENEAFDFIDFQLAEDIEAYRTGKPVSLLAKWLKSNNTSSKESRRLAQLTARHLELTDRQYRLLLAKLRSRINIVESQMSANKWPEIKYDKIPSRAGLIYRGAFKRHDEERYAEYIAAVCRGEKKINAAGNTPQDLVHVYFANGYWKLGPGFTAEDPTVEAMWKNLPDFVGTDENILCMVDVSGSMMGRPIEVSTGLGIYFAQRNRGAFHNIFMTFESHPEFVTLEDDVSLLENLRTTIHAPWGGSTDLDRACRHLLTFAKANNVPDADMPRRLIIISDMEINEATNGYGSRSASVTLHVDELRQQYADARYTMPQLIYWNVQARDNHFQTKSSTPGVMLASGSSPAVFEALIAMKDLEVTPYSAMLGVLNGERYSPITVG